MNMNMWVGVGTTPSDDDDGAPLATAAYVVVDGTTSSAGYDDAEVAEVAEVEEVPATTDASAKDHYNLPRPPP